MAVCPAPHLRLHMCPVMAGVTCVLSLQESRLPYHCRSYTCPITARVTCALSLQEHSCPITAVVTPALSLQESLLSYHCSSNACPITAGIVPIRAEAVGIIPKNGTYYGDVCLRNKCIFVVCYELSGPFLAQMNVLISTPF